MRGQTLHPRTEVLNKAQKNHSKKIRNEALLWLTSTFPEAFDNSRRIRPLKIGITNDILVHAAAAAEAGISKSKLREAVVLFTRRIDYLICLKAREVRIDLQGNPATSVTIEEAESAALKIKKRIEKSARNARKMITNQIRSNHYHAKAATTQSSDFLLQEKAPHYPERLPAYSAQTAIPPTAKTAPVVVTHKTTRQFDPEAVARLKEKLGLSRKTETDPADAE